MKTIGVYAPTSETKDVISWVNSIHSRFVDTNITLRTELIWFGVVFFDLRHTPIKHKEVIVVS